MGLILVPEPVWIQGLLRLALLRLFSVVREVHRHAGEELEGEELATKTGQLDVMLEYLWQVWGLCLHVFLEWVMFHVHCGAALLRV